MPEICNSPSFELAPCYSPHLMLLDLMRYGCGLGFTPCPINPRWLCSKMTRVKWAMNGSEVTVRDWIFDTSTSVRLQQDQSLLGCHKWVTYNCFHFYKSVLFIFLHRNENLNTPSSATHAGEQMWKTYWGLTLAKVPGQTSSGLLINKVERGLGM